MFRAGALAQQRGWTDPQIVTADELADSAPSGPPLIVLVPESMSRQQAQTVAALVGAGRAVAVIGEPPDPTIAGWIPTGVWHASTSEAPPPPPSAVNDPRSAPAPIELGGAPGAVPDDLRVDAVTAVLSRYDEVKDTHQDHQCYHEDLGYDLFQNGVLGAIRSQAALAAIGSQEGWGDVFQSEFLEPSAEMASELIAQVDNVVWDDGRAIWGGPGYLRAIVVAAADMAGSGGLAQELTFHPAVTPDDLGLLIDGALRRSEAYDVGRYLADVRCPEELLARLVGHSDPSIRDDVAGNVSTPRDALLILASDADRTPVPHEEAKSWGQRISEKARGNPRFREGVTLEAALEIASHKTYWIAESQIASHPSTPSGTLRRLGHSEYDTTRAAVAYNPNTPPDVFAELDAGSRSESGGSWYGVRAAVEASERWMQTHPPAPLQPCAGDWASFLTGDLDDQTVWARTAEALRLSMQEGQLLDLARSDVLLFRLAAVCHVDATIDVLRVAVEDLDSPKVILPSCDLGG